MEGCTFHFFTHAALKKHVENVHQALAFVCHYCQKRYKHQSTLKEHLNTHKEHKGFLCDICGRGFKTKDLCTSPSHLFTNSVTTNLRIFFLEISFVYFSKGQLISKCLLVSSLSSKKRTKTSRQVVKSNLFVHFWEKRWLEKIISNLSDL